MKESDEPSKRMSLSGDAKREVQIQKIRLRHIAEHFQFLLEPHFKRLELRLAQSRDVIIKLLRICLVHANKFRGVHIQSIEQLRPNIAGVVALFLVITVFTHYAIATAASTIPLNNLLLKDNDAVAVDAEVIDEEGDVEVEYANEPVETGYVVSATAFSVTNVPPREKKAVVTKKVWVPITAYSSTPDQTDGNPFITASGTRVRDGIVAANFLPIGTKVRIPEYYGDKVFVVEDRMNSRYWEKVDVWMPTRSEAMAFGLRRTYVEIINEI